MGRAEWDLVALAVAGACVWLGLYLHHRRHRSAINVATYHLRADQAGYRRMSFVGRKDVRVCADCGTPAPDYRAQEAHEAHHRAVDALADRVAELERVVAEKLGGGPAEESPAVPWDGLSGDVMEHAGAVDMGAAEAIEAPADEPEPEQVLQFRDKYKHLIGR